MVRRKRSEPDPANPGEMLDQKSADAGAVEGIEPQATLTVKGGLSKVRRQLGPSVAQKDPDPKDADSKDSLRQKLIESLRDPRNRYVVKRQTPKKESGVDIAMVVAQDDCPITFSDLEEEIFGTHGGKRYRVSVHDRDTGTTVAADTMERDIPPILEETKQDEQSRLERMIEPTVEEMNIQQINDQIVTVSAQARLESAKKQLAEIRGDPSNGKAKQDDPRVLAMEKTIERLEMERREEQREARHQKELGELKAQLAVISSAPKTNGQSDIQLILAQMVEDRKANQKQVSDILQKMQDDKMAALQASIDKIGSKDPMNGMKGMVETFSTLAGALGVKLPNIGRRGDDEDDEEPMEWWEKLADKAPEMIDKIAKLFSDAKGSGKTVNREEVMRIAKEAEDEAVKKGLNRLTTPPQTQHRLQAPAAPQENSLTAPPPPTAIVQQTKPPTPVPVAIPPLPPPPPGTTPAAPPALSLVPPVGQGTPDTAAVELSPVEAETLKRVAVVLDIFAAEVDMRPKVRDWTFECWQTIPEDLLEKICACETGDALCDVLGAIPRMAADPMKMLREKVNATPRTQAWVARSLTMLREWWKRSQEDPDFDPEEEGDPEQEPGEQSA